MIAYGREQLTIEYDDDGYIDNIIGYTWIIYTTEGPLRVSFYGGRIIDRVIEVLELAQWMQEGMA